MKKIEIFKENNRIFVESQRRLYKYNKLGHVEWIHAYPESRAEPGLEYIETGSNIVQGQYKWSANCSHLLFDVLADFIVGKYLFNKSKIIIKNNILSQQILNFLNAQAHPGIDFPENIDLNGIQQYDYLCNPWRFAGAKHIYLSKIIRESFSSLMVDDSEYPENIIINRRIKKSYNFTYGRNIENIEEIQNSAKKSGFEFKVVDLEDYSFADQIKLFYNAKLIISMHGSALVWLNFCKVNTKIIELITPYFYNNGNIKSDFWYISQNNNLNHKTVYIDESAIIGDGMHAYDHNVVVDWTFFEALLNEDL